MSEHLKQIVQDIVNGRGEQALVTFNKYVTAKTQELAGLTEGDAKRKKDIAAGKIVWKYKKGDKVTLKADKKEGWEEAKGKILGHDGEDEELYVVEVEPEDGDDDGIRGGVGIDQIKECLAEAKWSAEVQTKWTPPEGLFKKSADAIAKHLKSASDSHRQAASRLSFYINRAGKNLSAEEKARLKGAEAKLKALYA